MIGRKRHRNRKPSGRASSPKWACSYGANITCVTFEAAEWRARLGDAGPPTPSAAGAIATAEAGPTEGQAEPAVLALLEKGDHRAALELSIATLGAVVLACCPRIVANEALAEDARRGRFVEPIFNC
jgi:hypothetical protein